MNKPACLRRENLVTDVVFLLAALAAAALFCHFKLKLCEKFVTPEMFADIANHVGNKPWQYRILVPEIAKALHQLNLPVGLTLYGWARVIELGALFLSVVAFRRYLELFLHDRRLCSIFAMMIFLVLPFHLFFPRPYFANYWFDTPAMLFLILGLTFLHQKKWAWYYGLFVVATFNRETTCFLTLAYLFTAFGREKLPKIAAHCGAQFVIWMSIKLALGRMFVGNPGPEGFEWMDGSGVPHWMDNLRYFANPGNYPAFASIMGFLWIPVVFCYRRIGSEFARRSLWVIPPFFAGMFLVANIYELRIFAELVPIVMTAFFLILTDLVRTARIGDGG